MARLLHYTVDHTQERDVEREKDDGEEERERKENTVENDTDSVVKVDM